MSPGALTVGAIVSQTPHNSSVIINVLIKIKMLLAYAHHAAKQHMEVLWIICLLSLSGMSKFFLVWLDKPKLYTKQNNRDLFGVSN